MMSSADYLFIYSSMGNIHSMAAATAAAAAAAADIRLDLTVVVVVPREDFLQLVLVVTCPSIPDLVRRHEYSE